MLYQIFSSLFLLILAEFFILKKQKYTAKKVVYFIQLKFSNDKKRKNK